MPYLGHVIIIVCVAFLISAQEDYCRLTRDYYKEVQAFPRVLSWRGRERELVLHCGSTPSCAAAALLQALLVHTLAYRRVTLRIGPHRLHAFAASQGNSTDWNYPEIIVDLSTSWRPSDEYVNMINGIGGLAGPRLQEFGLSTVPARRQLLARLSVAASTRSSCISSHHYNFYTNYSLLEDCNFLNESTDKKAPLYIVNDTFLYEIPDNANLFDELVIELQNRVNATSLLLDLQSITRRHLEQLLLKDISLLFLDFNLYTSVMAVQSPPCVSPYSKCEQDLDSSIALRVTDVLTLRTSSTELLELLYKFSPPKQYLRNFAMLEASVTDEIAEQTACEWISDNIDQVDEWRYSIFKTYTVVIFICHEDFHAEPYNNTIQKIGEYITEMKALDSRFDFEIYAESVDCLDENHMRTVLWTKYLTMAHLYHLIGVLVPGSVGAVSMSALARDNDVPTLAYDALSSRSVPGAWHLAPLSLRVTALGHFIRSCHWTRLAVISEPTKTANDFIEALENEDGFVVGKFELPLDVSKKSIIDVLSDMRRNHSRIIFINANSVTVSNVLREARNLKMDAEDEYVWIVRDWHQNETFPHVTYYTISPYAQTRLNYFNDGQKKSDIGRIERERRDVNWPLDTKGPWPTRHGSTIVDGLWLLAQSFEEVWRQRPGARNDLRNGQTTRALETILSGKPVRGIFENLQFEGGELTGSSMYAEKWRNRQSKLLSSWHVGKGQPGIRIKPIANPIHDGDITCILRRGNPFSPICLDSAWASGLVALIVIPLGVLFVIRHTKLYLKRRDEALHKEFLANRDRCFADLCGWHVSRSDLEIIGYLGQGHFGRVSLGKLQTDKGVWCSVAVKQLHEGASPAEESEFLREACTLATLSHEYVVRLVGVCDEGGPPLLLTEVALFGDLLGYLSARRHLAEGGVALEEAEHVSAAALTRLAREAATALQHLASRGVVHRDVRAANCLVDARRSLKLADFGMARRTGAAEYVCMRRAVVPVRWMATEAVTRGAFSAASDVWALGVLLLELMTLGARPWGASPPDRVLRRVAAGERPPLPRDASPPARALTALCWADVTERPSAGQVRAYLERHPRALRPALAGPENSDSDSGYIENAYSLHSTSESTATKYSYYLPSSMEEEATLTY